MADQEIPARYQWRVKHRQTVMLYAQSHSLRAAARHFGLDRKTVRRWYARWRTAGVQGYSVVIPAKDHGASAPTWSS